MRHPAGSGIAPPRMTYITQTRLDDPGISGPVLELRADMSIATRNRMATDDLVEGIRLFRLAAALGWLDIRLRYRGSLLGPLWLTLSTAVMVVALGVLYSALFKMQLHDYLPWLALSIVLWNFLSSLVTEGCGCFTEAEAMIRSLRMPYMLYALRVVVRNVLVLGHNVIVIAGVFAVFLVPPTFVALLALPGLALWIVDAVAATVLLGAFCARFRDIPPIVASVMQLAFFLSPIIWKPELLGNHAWLLPLNPFYALFELVRAPLLGDAVSGITAASALIYSALLCAISWAVFVRVRGRLAFWV